jgi:hydrogenase maturation factor
MTHFPHCPVCGATMRQTRRGATLQKRGPAYVCPVDEAETVPDAEGRLSRVPDAKHAQSRRVYEAHELEATHA